MKHTALIVLFFVFSAVFCFAQADLQPAAIVKLTKSEPITVKQFRTEVEKMEKALEKTLSESEKKQVLDAMIDERLVIQAADRDKITVSDGELNQQIDKLKDGLSQQAGRKLSDAEFATAIKTQTGYDMATYREQGKRQLVMQKYLLSKKQNLFDSMKEPAEAEILDMYNLEKMRFIRPDTVCLSFVLVPFGSDKSKAKELAERLHREVGGNSNKFNEVALKAKVANSGYQSDSDYLPRMREAQQAYGEDFVKTAFNLKLQEVSKLIELPATSPMPGYIFFKPTEIYAMKNLDLDDIYRLGIPMTVRQTIQYALMQEKQAAVIEQATKEIITELRANGKSFEIFPKNLGW